MKRLFFYNVSIFFAILSTVCAISAVAVAEIVNPILITIPTSCGELIDKITILEIKADHIKNAEKLGNIHNELEALMLVYKELPHSYELDTLKLTLKEINLILWDIEDRIRQKENECCFDTHFIELARQIYITNDKRADVKRTINELLGSHLIEEKSYSS